MQDEFFPLCNMISTMESPKRVAIYGRVSSASQKARDLSVPEQLERLREFVISKGWVVTSEFRDDGKSRASAKGRPQFEAMIRRAKSPEHPFDLILTRDLSRFGRAGSKDAVLREELRELGVAVDNIEAPSGDMFGTFNADSELNETILGAVAKRGRTATTAAMIQGQKRLARMGGLPGRQGTGYGYTSEWVGVGDGKPKRVVAIQPNEAAIVREMFSRYAKGASIKEVTRWLNGSSVAPPGNGSREALEWYDTTVRAILKNESYLGRVVFGRVRKVRNAKGTKVNRPGLSEPIRTDGAFPAIITQELFEKVQARLQSRSNRIMPGKDNPGNMLRGIGRCKHCGWHMAHQKHSQNGRWYYMCGKCKTHKAPNVGPGCIGIYYAEYVDESVEHFLKQVGQMSPNVIRSAIAAYNKSASDFRGLDATSLLDNAIASKESEVTNLAKSLAKRYSSAVQELLEEAEDRLADLKGKREYVASAIIVLKVDEQRVLDAHTSISDVMQTSEPLKVRTLLAEIVSFVDVDLAKRAERDSSQYGLKLDRPAVRELSKKDETAIASRMTKMAAKGVMDAAALAGIDSRVGVSMSGLGPLRFIAKWDLGNLESATADALERIGRSIAG